MNQELAYLVSNYDFEKLQKGCKVILYSQLADFENLTELLPTDNVCFILIKTNLNSGHWTCLNRKNNIFYYFDSYGKIFDGELKTIDKNIKIKLHEDKYLLTPLIKKLIQNNYKVFYNNFQYQKYDPNINTCGKWSLIFTKFIFLSTNSDNQPKTIIFKNRILGIAKEYNIKLLDVLVSILYDSFE